jgi:hypothetical protein
MELNREQTIEALKYAIIANENIVKEFNIPETVTVKIMRNALSLIKELTEERDGLENLIYEMSKIENRMSDTIEELTQKLECANLEIEVKNRICESYMLQYGTVADKEVWLKKERADTVLKYGEKVYQLILGFVGETLSEQDKDYITVRLGQIAKEMSEGV